ncbi:hypothetical protein BKI52_11740 [marine bacterium AO1-C]|nr:hypothetical protein BKI52_11740 [marine bacterium AO1-C]
MTGNLSLFLQKFQAQSYEKKRAACKGHSHFFAVFWVACNAQVSDKLARVINNEVKSQYLVAATRLTS